MEPGDGVDTTAADNVKAANLAADNVKAADLTLAAVEEMFGDQLPENAATFRSKGASALMREHDLDRLLQSLKVDDPPPPKLKTVYDQWDVVADDEPEYGSEPADDEPGIDRRLRDMEGVVASIDDTTVATRDTVRDMFEIANDTSYEMSKARKDLQNIKFEIETLKALVASQSEETRSMREYMAKLVRMLANGGLLKKPDEPGPLKKPDEP
ncbi:MAG: hypothetical protein WC700_10090 [Gemmatimonadaceae bacterium]|jgi:hypothetical protein